MKMEANYSIQDRTIVVMVINEGFRMRETTPARYILTK